MRNEATSYQLPATSYQLPATSYQPPATSHHSIPGYLCRYISTRYLAIVARSIPVGTSVLGHRSCDWVEMRNEATGTYQTPACRYLAELSVVVAMMMMMMMILRQLRTFEKKESVNGTSSRVFEESGTGLCIDLELRRKWDWNLESGTVETWSTWSLSRGFPDRSAWIENLRVVICFNWCNWTTNASPSLALVFGPSVLPSGLPSGWFSVSVVHRALSVLASSILSLSCWEIILNADFDCIWLSFDVMIMCGGWSIQYRAHSQSGGIGIA